MLAAIGVIICAKQLHVLMGVVPQAHEPLGLIAELPKSLLNANPEILVIGVLALVILFGHQILKERMRWLAKVPAPLLALGMAMPLGLYFDLEHAHTYSWQGHAWPIGPNFLVTLPASLFAAITTPDWSAITSATSIKYIVMFTLVGSLESLLSAKAVDLLDPQHRRSNLDRDLFATGAGNFVAAWIGGIPMISEIVRSSANISYGAQSRRSNFVHGCCLLLFVALVPGLIHRIPLAALAAMLIVTGVRLASPAEFARTFRIGSEQLVVFTTTLVVTLATDLLVGVAAGICAKLVVHLRHGAPLRGLFTPEIAEESDGERAVITVRNSALFTNSLGLTRRLAALQGHQVVVIDLGDTRLVDHTVMEKLHHLREEWERDGRRLELIGLEGHETLSPHPLAARRKPRDGGPIMRKTTEVA
jgi:MFS superfamily sulfate permease-like transporter